MNNGFSAIRRVEVHQDFIEDMYDFFRESGSKGFESVALWAGEEHSDIFCVSHIIFPTQTLYKTPHGLSYSVDGNELERINQWLYQNKKTLIAQIHSHPKEAYHSGVDDDFAIVTTIGSFSIVVPDFGSKDVNLAGSAFFRLSDKGWVEYKQNEYQSLLKIIK